MSRMEATIGPILSKVDNVLNRIDEMKKTKRNKKLTMQNLVKTIEDNSECKFTIRFFKISTLTLQWTTWKKANKFVILSAEWTQGPTRDFK